MMRVDHRGQPQNSRELQVPLPGCDSSVLAQISLGGRKKAQPAFDEALTSSTMARRPPLIKLVQPLHAGQ